MQMILQWAHYFNKTFQHQLDLNGAENYMGSGSRKGDINIDINSQHISVTYKSKK